MTKSNPSEPVPSPKQKEIIESKGDTIVISNPGTGKTFTLSRKVINLLENGVEPEDILCLTYTEKAKKEMFDAIFNAKRKFPDSDVMKINIHTFHSYALNYLLDNGLISGDIIGNNILRFNILESFENNQALNYSKNYIISDFMPKVENSLRYIKNFGITPDKIEIKKSEKLLEKSHDEKRSSFTTKEMKALLTYIVAAYKHYEDSKTDTVDFSDVLLTFIEKFHGEKFPYVLVDEMQDMNEIEAQIVEMVSENLFLVGDVKQAIFGFQGGSTKNFEKFKKTCKPMVLATNRRSTQQILDYSKNYFLGKTEQRAKFEEQLENFNSPSIPPGPIPKIFSTAARLTKTRHIIEENEGKTIGVIMRTNRQIIEISKHLDINNVPYTSTSSKAVTKQARDEIKNFIKGLISNRIEDKISAAFTIFSPYTLKEAFALSDAHKKKDAQKVAEINSWKINLTREDLNKLFEETIYPLCVSKGSEWLSTAVSVEQQIDEYFKFETPTFVGLFDFIDIGEESYFERNKEEKTTLSTVHKAKGRQFDIVIYIPNIRSDSNRWIDEITSAILGAKGIDPEDEVAEESLRIDFVSFTRAKQKLFVIVDDRHAKNFHLENLSEIEVDTEKDELVSSVLNNRLSEAYSKFLAGKFPEAEKQLKSEKPWLREYILSYFQSVDHFSYSSIKTKPYDFLKAQIVKMPFVSSAADFGSNVHKALEKIIMDKAKLEDFPDDQQKAIKNGQAAIEKLKNDYPGLTIEATEKHQLMPIKSLTNYNEKDSLMFKGFIDAVFKHDSGYILVDWKTSKKISSEHKRQLAVYKKMYSKLENVPEDKITTCVIYVSLTGNVNTGRNDWSIEIGTRDVFPTFEKHLQQVLGWRKDPDKFIEKLLAETATDSLHQAILDKLADNSK